MFPHYSKFPKHQDKYSNYIDYILAKKSYGWEEQMFHRQLKEEMKSNISENFDRQMKLRGLLEELETEDRNQIIDNEFTKRIEEGKKVQA